MILPHIPLNKLTKSMYPTDDFAHIKNRMLTAYGLSFDYLCKTYQYPSIAAPMIPASLPSFAILISVCLTAELVYCSFEITS